MNQKILHTPEGVRDIYGEECEQRQVLLGKLRHVLASYGYREIETPTFEFFDVFGNEVDGVSQEVVDASDFSLEIPQFGTKHSLNVSVSVGVVLWHFTFRKLLYKVNPR